MITTLAQVLFLVSSIALCALILLQQSKGSGMGALGGGASNTVFGAKGAGSFLYKTTRLLAAIFFIGALGLGYLQNQSVINDSILEDTHLAEKKVDVGLDVPVPSVDNADPASNTDIPVSKQTQ